jgi:hypothetical protein
MRGHGSKQANRDTFIVEFALAAVRFARFFTIAGWIEQNFSWLFVEIWVVAWAVIAIIFYTGSLVVPDFLFIPSAIVGFLRVNEIITTHIEQLLTRNIHALRSYRRSFVLLVFNYIEIILWFATFYALFIHYGWLQANGPAVLALLRESIGLMVASSSGGFTLKPYLSPWIVATLQSGIGLFMTTVVAARLISILPSPRTLDVDEGRSEQD